MRRDGASKIWPLLMAAALVLALAPGAARAATVSLNADATQLRGRAFDLSVAVDSVSAAYGVAFDLIYDPAYLEVVDKGDGNPVDPTVAEGALFNSDGQGTTYLRAALQEDAPGVLVLGLTRSGVSTGVDALSETEIMAVSFMPKKKGSTEITFQAQAMLDASNTALTMDLWDPITLDIQILEGDIDGSFVVDLADAIMVLKVLIGIAQNGVNSDNAIEERGEVGLQEAIYILQAVAEE